MSGRDPSRGVVTSRLHLFEACRYQAQVSIEHAAGGQTGGHDFDRHAGLVEALHYLGRGQLAEAKVTQQHLSQVLAVGLADVRTTPVNRLGQAPVA